MAAVGRHHKRCAAASARGTSFEVFFVVAMYRLDVVGIVVDLVDNVRDVEVVVVDFDVDVDDVDLDVDLVDVERVDVRRVDVRMSVQASQTQGYKFVSRLQ